MSVSAFPTHHPFIGGFCGVGGPANDWSSWNFLELEIPEGRKSHHWLRYTHTGFYFVPLLYRSTRLDYSHACLVWYFFFLWDHVSCNRPCCLAMYPITGLHQWYSFCCCYSTFIRRRNYQSDKKACTFYRVSRKQFSAISSILAYTGRIPALVSSALRQFIQWCFVSTFLWKTTLRQSSKRALPCYQLWWLVIWLLFIHLSSASSLPSFLLPFP